MMKRSALTLLVALLSAATALGQNVNGGCSGYVDTTTIPYATCEPAHTIGAHCDTIEQKISFYYLGDNNGPPAAVTDISLIGMRYWKPLTATVGECHPFWNTPTSTYIGPGRYRVEHSGYDVNYSTLFDPPCTRGEFHRQRKTAVCDYGCIIKPYTGCPFGTIDAGNGMCCTITPLLIDTAGDGFQMTSVANGVSFVWVPGQAAEATAWTVAGDDDGWLCLDRNANGVIDNGTELFGNFTQQPAGANPNGFKALAVYDEPHLGGNGDGKIDASDQIAPQLRVWVDVNHDGVSQITELRSPAYYGIVAINLAYTEAQQSDQYDNVARFKSEAYDAQGKRHSWVLDMYPMTRGDVPQ